MQAGSLAGGPVRSLRSYAIVNGVHRPMLDWSLDREIGSDLPTGVAGGTGVVQATGSVTWAPGTVDNGSRSPWNPGMGWVPASGDRIEIWQGDDATSWIQFTGVIDDTTGTVGGTMTSTIVDRIDDLSARADLPPLVDVMPPITAGGAFRRVRISPRGILVLAMRRGGFYQTPPPRRTRLWTYRLCPLCGRTSGPSPSAIRSLMRRWPRTGRTESSSRTAPPATNLAIPAPGTAPCS